MKTKSQKIILALISLSFSCAGFADDASSSSSSSDSRYSFGPSCGSAGQWTTKALQASQTLINTITNLATDPNCSGVSVVIKSLIAQQAQLQAQNLANQANKSSQETPAQAQNKMTALSGVVTSTDPSLKPFAERAEQAYTKEALLNAITNPKLKFVEGRVTQSATQLESGLVSTNVLIQLAQTLPVYDSCLIGRPTSETGLLVSSIVGLGAAMASSSTGPAPLTSQLVQSILELVHNSKFAAGIKTIKQEQFTQSLSCLMEVSTEAYCSVLDMQKLVNNPAFTPEPAPAKKEDNKANVKTAAKAKTSRKDKNPSDSLSGYNILTIHLPNVYKWAQQVQFGVAARTDADASFKNNAIQLVSAFQQKANSLPTFLWSAENQLQSQKDPTARKQTLIAAIQQITALIDADLSPTNFFYQTQSKFVLPFYLLGEGNNVPGCVFETIGGSPCDPIGQLNIPGKFTRLDNFDDSFVTNEVEGLLSNLIQGATQKANVYYQKRVVPNTIDLVLQSLNSPTYSVKDSFEFIEGYLAYLKDFTQQYGSDDANMRMMAGGIDDAYIRFNEILQAYDRLENLRKLDSHSPDYVEAINKAYNDVVNTVYNQFQMSVQHDGYVVSIMNDLISAEYRLRLKKGLGLSGSERQFLIASSQDLLDTIRAAQFTNKTDILTDLGNANVINEKNLEALDSVFFDSYYNRIQTLNRRIADKDMSEASNNKASSDSAYLDIHTDALAQENPKIMKWCSIGGNWAKTICAKVLHPDRYTTDHTIAAATEPTHDTANGDFKRKRDILCMQSLAFVSRRARFSSAKSVNLESRPELGLCDHLELQGDAWKDLSPEKQNQFLNMNANYDSILAATQKPYSKAKGLEVKKANDSAICAYRNFRRNNLVYWMTKDLDVRVTNTPIDKLIEARKERAIPAAAASASAPAPVAIPASAPASAPAKR